MSVVRRQELIERQENWDEYCQARIVICRPCHLCYLGSSALNITAASLLSSQYNLWHISQISKLTYWIICDLDWENRGPGVVCLFEFITKMSVIHISHWTWHRARVTQGCWNAAILIIADMPRLDWVRGHEPWSSGSATWSWPLGYHQGSQNLECGVESRSVSLIKKFKNVIEWSGFDASELWSSH